MVEVIAEISGNHGGSLDNAIRLIEAAQSAGADAVKFQCFEPARLAGSRMGLIWKGKTLNFEELYILYQKTHTPKKWFPTLIAKCDELNIPWLSSAFDSNDVAFLETLNCPRYKISAYEMLDGDLIKAVVDTGKPIIMSVRHTDRCTILHATPYDGGYSPLGLSDHYHRGSDHLEVGSDIAGCPIVERHLCLLDVETEDSGFSSTPEEFTEYVHNIRSAMTQV